MNELSKVIEELSKKFILDPMLPSTGTRLSFKVKSYSIRISYSLTYFKSITINLDYLALSLLEKEDFWVLFPSDDGQEARIALPDITTLVAEIEASLEAHKV